MCCVEVPLELGILYVNLGALGTLEPGPALTLVMDLDQMVFHILHKTHPPQLYRALNQRCGTVDVGSAQALSLSIKFWFWYRLQLLTFSTYL
jgi:hypothetical protein